MPSPCSCTSVQLRNLPPLPSILSYPSSDRIAHFWRHLWHSLVPRIRQFQRPPALRGVISHVESGGDLAQFMASEEVLMVIMLWLHVDVVVESRRAHVEMLIQVL